MKGISLSAEICRGFRQTKMHCYGPNLFWHGCNKSWILGPQPIDYMFFCRTWIVKSGHGTAPVLVIGSRHVSGEIHIIPNMEHKDRMVALSVEKRFYVILVAQWMKVSDIHNYMYVFIWKLISFQGKEPGTLLMTTKPHHNCLQVY